MNARRLFASTSAGPRAPSVSAKLVNRARSRAYASRVFVAEPFSSDRKSWNRSRRNARAASSGISGADTSVGPAPANQPPGSERHDDDRAGADPDPLLALGDAGLQHVEVRAGGERE